MHKYVYVLNNTINHTDPSGEFPPDIDAGQGMGSDPYFWEIASRVLGENAPTRTDWYSSLSTVDRVMAIRAYVDYLSRPGHYVDMHRRIGYQSVLEWYLVVWAEYAEGSSINAFLGPCVPTADYAEALAEEGLLRTMARMVSDPDFQVPLLVGIAEAVRGAGASGGEGLPPAATPAPIRAAPSGELPDVALGISDHLFEFAYHTVPEAKPFFQWEESGLSGPTFPNFPRAFETAMDRTPRIHFNLDGIDDIPAALRQGRSAMWGPRNMTNTELYLVTSNLDWFAKTTFYQGGAPLSSAEVTRLLGGP